MYYNKKLLGVCVMSKKKNSRKRKGTNRIYFFFVFAFVFVVMAIQITNLVRKNASYAAEEARLEKEKEYQVERHEELEQYEEYTNSREYKEYIARTKLGQVYPNWIIFREND